MVLTLVRTLHASAEAAPVREDNEGQLLAVEVTYRLSRLVGGVREPDLPGLLDHLATKLSLLATISLSKHLSI